MIILTLNLIVILFNIVFSVKCYGAKGVLNCFEDDSICFIKHVYAISFTILGCTTRSAFAPHRLAELDAEGSSCEIVVVDVNHCICQTDLCNKIEVNYIGATGYKDPHFTPIGTEKAYI